MERRLDQIGNLDAPKVSAERHQDFDKDVMRHRAGRVHALQRHDDGLRLERANTDGQDALAIALLEQEQRRGTRRSDAQTGDGDLNHAAPTVWDFIGLRVTRYAVTAA